MHEGRMRQHHPKSPIQPERSSALIFVAGAALAFLVWGWMQDGPADPPNAAEVAPHSPERAGAASNVDDRMEPLDPALSYASRAQAKLMEAFSDDDYPQQAIRNEEQGMVAFKLRIDRHGRDSKCVIVESSGHRSLDDATCRILSERVRAVPARSDRGDAIPDNMEGRIRLALPDE